MRDNRNMKSILDLDADELGKWLVDNGSKKYRSKQVVNWVYKNRISSFDDMNNVDQMTIDLLKDNFFINSVKVVSTSGSRKDDSKKILIGLFDGLKVECVVIPPSINKKNSLKEEAQLSYTLCVSTQVGCPLACKFCASGLYGLNRNLKCHEIIEQLLVAEKHFNIKVGNVVFMGMGEPLANYSNTIKAAESMHERTFFNMAYRQITISTSGIVPKIKKLADDGKKFRLAISLHAPNDDVRDQIMPINEKYPLKKLLEVLDYYQKKINMRITLEYILLRNFNDLLEHAEQLSVIAKKYDAHVNLIPYNPIDQFSWKRPNDFAQKKFLNILRKNKINATLRVSKGRDVNAACGQLALNK